MSDASSKLAQSRKAIMDHIARKQRRHDPREETVQGEALLDDAQEEARRSEEPRPRGGGWFGRMKYGVRAWWRYHPAHMAVDFASPMMRGPSQTQDIPLRSSPAASRAGAAPRSSSPSASIRIFNPR